MNINSLLRGYIDNNIKPKKEKNELISKYYNEISDLLEKKGYYTFRSGSYARGTAITPVNDLDIICECDEYDIDNFKNSIKGKGLYKILSDKYGEENINFQSSSIGISLGEEDGFGIDIVIALKINEFNNYGDNLYMVPKLLYSTRKERKENYKKIKTLKCGSENNLLIKSDPKGYKKELKQIKDNNNNIIYATRFLKKWKKVIKKEYFGENEKCLKSFHIEEAVKT